MGYIVNIEEWNYVEVLHRHEVNMHDRVVGEFLYARFAYNIIQQLPSFWRSLDSVPIPQAISDARKRRLQAERQKNDEESVDSELETDYERGCEDGACFPYHVVLRRWQQIMCARVKMSYNRAMTVHTQGLCDMSY